MSGRGPQMLLLFLFAAVAGAFLTITVTQTVFEDTSGNRALANLSTVEKAFRCYTPQYAGDSGSIGDTLSGWQPAETCHIVSMDQRIQRCNGWWPGNPVEERNCSYTTRNVEPVTYLPDPGNHIPTPFDTADYDVTVYGPERIGTNNPQQLRFLPDGRILLAATTWQLLVLDKGMNVVQDANIQDAVNASDILTGGFPRINGMAVPASFERTQHIYVHWTVRGQEGGENSLFDHNASRHFVSRFELAEDGLQHDAFYLNISGAFHHHGGGVRIGPDRKLYVTLGDAHEPAWAQRFDTYRGKILRLNRNGTVPASNPFPDSYIYTYGHRNPQGIAWNPVTGTVYAVDHGQRRHDELNRLAAGKNYGWGKYGCDAQRNPEVALRTDEYISPVRCYRHWTLAPSRMTFVDTPGHPWYGDLFVAGLRGKHLRRYVMDGDTIVEERIFYVQDSAPSNAGMSRRLRDVVYHNKSLWVLGDEYGLAQITPAGE